MIQGNIYKTLPRGFYGALVAILLLGSTAGLPASAQITTEGPGAYARVMVIVNTNSWHSVQIGAYFAQRRGIPSSRICTIAVDTTEEQDSLQQLQTIWTIKAWMASQGLTDSIYYIVTTKGCPLYVNLVNQELGTPGYGGETSFEDNLSAMGGPDSVFICQVKAADAANWSGWYHNSTSRFARGPSMPIYLVTRLDGYNLEDVKAMIRRSEHTPAALDGTNLWVLDGANSGFHIAESQARASATADSLQAKGVPSGDILLDLTTTYLRSRDSVIGYWSAGSNDPASGGNVAGTEPGNAWKNGALAIIYVSTSARSFQTGTTYGQSLIADWIAEGVTGASGAVAEPFGGGCHYPQIVYNRYVQGWTLAESYRAGQLWDVWRQVTIGDPLTRLGRNFQVPVLTYSDSIHLQAPGTAAYSYKLDTLDVVNTTEVAVVVYAAHLPSKHKWAITFQPDTLQPGDTLLVPVRYDRALVGPDTATLTLQTSLDTLGIKLTGAHVSGPSPLSKITDAGDSLTASTSITYNVASASTAARIELLDNTGRIVDVIAGLDYSTGPHTISYNGSTLKKQTYRLRLTVVPIAGTKASITGRTIPKK